MDICCFFFFKQKTAYEMRISDWSSDVCSSDLSKSVRDVAAVLGIGRRHHRIACRQVIARTIFSDGQAMRTQMTFKSLVGLAFDKADDCVAPCKAFANTYGWKQLDRHRVV